MKGGTQALDVSHLATEIAEELGDQWSSAAGSHAGDHSAYLVGPVGELIQIRYGGWQARYQGRLVLYGTFDAELSRFQADPGARYVITVSPTSSATRIAKEITRRLLPEYREAVRRACDRRTAAEDLRRRRDHLMPQLAQALDGELVERRGEPVVIFGAEASGRVQVHDDEAVELQVRLRDADALTFARRFGTSTGGSDV
ncbi:hypothetical protein [Amycolatopsis circi]|uniref:hypothetical protein n=1 Tax=Amycolatopsis circi TaxID=871959 RepID=UPI000E26E511|nr:hypothetical protein [Amycolatopsis circi]